MSSALTLDQLREVLPVKFKKTVNQVLVDEINSVLSDPNMFESYRDSFLSYMRVLEDGKYKISDYLRAVKFCCHKLAGATDKEAYIKTFPERFQKFVNNNTSSKDIASYISAYGKTKLVTEILKQSLVPVWVLNQALRQDAINKLYTIMQDENTSPFNAIQAADKLLNHTAPPEVSTLQLNITDDNAANGINELKEALYGLASQQKQMIQNEQLTVRDVSNNKLGITYDHDS